MNKNTRISDIMTTDLIVTTRNTTLDKVKEVFDTHTFHHLPVTDNGKLCGIISKIDLYRVTHSLDLFNSKSDIKLNNRLLRSLLVEEIMASNMVVVSPDDMLSHAAELLLFNQFHALPVVEGDNLVGIVTTFDLIKYAYA